VTRPATGLPPLPALHALADVLIPAGPDMPSASQADPDGSWTAHVLGIRPELAAPFRDALERALGAESIDELIEAFKDQPGDLGVLTLVVAGAYFLNPEVRRRIGYPGQLPQPAVEWSFGTKPQIQRVIARGEIYRPTPG
jgi:hypothetical protein